jgi:hypothetical protein
MNLLAEGKCPQCHEVFQIKPAEAGLPLDTRLATPARRHGRRPVHCTRANQRRLQRIKPSNDLFRKIAALFVLSILILMPLFYAGVWAVLFWMYWLATSQSGRARLLSFGLGSCRICIAVSSQAAGRATAAS